MVCSLLELQGEAIGSPEGKEALEVSAQRIYAIARHRPRPCRRGA
jgi:hypothetical protein